MSSAEKNVLVLKDGAANKAGSRIRYGCKFGEKVLLRGKSIGSPFHQIYNRTLFLNQPYLWTSPCMPHVPPLSKHTIITSVVVLGVLFW